MITSSEYTELTIEDSSTLLISQFVVTGTSEALEKRDSFVGNGTNTIFAMSSIPTDVSTIKVYLNGRLMRLNDDYSIAGTNITMLIFTPLATDNIDIIYS